MPHWPCWARVWRTVCLSCPSLLSCLQLHLSPQCMHPSAPPWLTSLHHLFSPPGGAHQGPRCFSVFLNVFVACVFPLSMSVWCTQEAENNQGIDPRPFSGLCLCALFPVCTGQLLVSSQGSACLGRPPHHRVTRITDTRTSCPGFMWAQGIQTQGFRHRHTLLFIPTELTFSRADNKLAAGYHIPGTFKLLILLKFQKIRYSLRVL